MRIVQELLASSRVSQALPSSTVAENALSVYLVRGSLDTTLVIFQ